MRFQEIKTQSPWYYFVPVNNGFLEQYNNFIYIKEIFRICGAGITTAHDKFVINRDEKTLIDKFVKFRNSPASAKTLHETFHVKQKKGWDILKAWNNLQAFNEEDIKNIIKDISYRPFDNRKIAFHQDIVWRTVDKIMQHMLAGDNLGLIVSRSGTGLNNWKEVQVSDKMVEYGIMSMRPGNGSPLFPLYLYDSEKTLLDDTPTKQENFTESLNATLSA